MQQGGAESRIALARYADSAKVALYYSRAALTEHGGKSIDLAHLLIGIMKADTVGMAEALSPELALQRVSECLTSHISASELLAESVEVPFGGETLEVLMIAEKFADEYGHDVITADHLLLGLLWGNSGPAVECLREAGVDTNRAAATLAARLKKQPRNAV
ncbi:MAG: Clp protease N-terminal domain-containing protein [Vicinamibacterales bacterium]